MQRGELAKEMAGTVGPQRRFGGFEDVAHLRHDGEDVASGGGGGDQRPKPAIAGRASAGHQPGVLEAGGDLADA